jgi:serine/threonine protein phosphatase PrpC
MRGVAVARRLRVVAFGATDAGRRRSRNEDAFGILEDEGVLVVADGMGGHRGGSVASKMAVEGVVTAFREARGDHAGALERLRRDRPRVGTTEPMWKVEPATEPTEPQGAVPAQGAPARETAASGDDKRNRGGGGNSGARKRASTSGGLGRATTAPMGSEDTPPAGLGDKGAFAYSAALTLLQVSVRQASAAIFSVAREEADLHGMGTTLTAAVIDGDRLHVAHAGDSRCYLWREGELKQLTEDHSWIAEQLRVGAITEIEAKQSRYRHVITRSVGVERHADVEVRSVAVAPGDRLLLCSDGLFGLVPDEDLAKLLGSEDLAALPAQLIALANERGGDDNITVVVGALG